MAAMTSYERFKRMYEHREADRVPITDYAWGATVKRWRREGMPAGVDYTEFFDLDRIEGIHVDNSPRYPVRTIEETDEHIIYTSKWGVTEKQWKNATSTPDFIDHTVVDRDSWEKAKARMTPDRSRVDWERLEKNYARWRKEGYWLVGGFWFGFDVTHSWMVGTERLLMALIEDPEWCVDMFNTFLDLDIAMFDQVWDAGYHFDCISWPDDMSYRQHQFFSLATYRELLKPVHARAVEWARRRGIKAHLHSCGDVRPFVPELLEIGIDALNPLEVKAGVDPVALKRLYGDRLVLHGGMNAVLWDKPDELEAQMRETLPALKENGGYIFSSDHSVPSSISLEDFRRIVNLAKKLGSYE